MVPLPASLRVNDLAAAAEVDFIVKKATKRLYSLRVLRKACVQQADLVRIYCLLIRSVLEYGAPVWSALPGYLTNAIESVRRRALRIICPLVGYETALISTGFVSLEARRANLLTKYFSKSKDTPHIRDVIPLVTQVSHGYTLRSVSSRDVRMSARTERFRSFINMRYV